MTTNRKLKIGGEARDGIVVVRENGNAIAIFLPGGTRDSTPLQDAHAFVEAVKAAHTAEPGGHPAWVAGTTYRTGDRVSHKGFIWEITIDVAYASIPPAVGTMGDGRLDESLWRKIGPAVAGPTPDALDKVLAEIPPEELSVKLDAAMKAPQPKPKPGETFTDYMRRVSETQGLPKGITEILTGMAGKVDTGEPFPGRRDDEVRIRSFDNLEDMLEAIGATESDEDADDCDCGICMLRRHWYTDDGELRQGRSLAALIKGMAIVTRKGSEDREVETAARRVAASLYIAGISTDADVGVVGLELPISLDQKAVLAAVAIKMDGFSDVEQVAVH
jgi:hypothetical protein